MKDQLRFLLDRSPAPRPKNTVREYLQARILQSLQKKGAMTSLAFHGGTALRFLHGLPRFSEDLDFTLETQPQHFDFRSCLRRIKLDLTAEAYDVGLKVQEKRTVHSSFIQFSGLLYELGLSPHQNEKLSVKIEVDTNPPAGAGLATTIVRRHLVLHLRHHDRASLLAGKLHAILQRPYVKGRDWFDLQWYLSNPTWPEPNLVLLNNALHQSKWTQGELKPHNWRQMVRQRLLTVRWAKVLSDVQPFVESPDFMTLTRDGLSSLLQTQLSS
jgi:predicted nucleotidyltransferase component of viral defense system